MTFKNMKFDDSVVMRSLEKVAISKGMIKPDEIQKIAAAKEPQASEFFAENLLTLCQGLRAQGFDKYAAELEVKFLMLKKAEHQFYDITGETGEDLVEDAHPEGSKLLDKGWGDLGTVETITEKHKKMVEIINKQPTGKLAGNNILNAVKIVLAQKPVQKKVLKTPFDRAKAILAPAQQNIAKITNWMQAKTTASESGAAGVVLRPMIGGYGLNLFKNLSSGFNSRIAAKYNDFIGSRQVSSIQEMISEAQEYVKLLMGQNGPIAGVEPSIRQEGINALRNAIAAFSSAIAIMSQEGAKLEEVPGDTGDEGGEEIETSSPGVPSATALGPNLMKVNNATTIMKNDTAKLAIDLDQLAENPVLAQNPEWDAYTNSIKNWLQTCIKDMGIIASKAAAVKGTDIALENISNLTSGTSLFNKVVSYKQLIDTMNGYRKGINARIIAIREAF